MEPPATRLAPVDRPPAIASAALGAGNADAPLLREAWLRFGLCLPMLLWGLGYFWPPLNHDAGALLQFAERLRHGERLYVDLIDINPPMVFLIDLIPVMVGEILGIGSVWALTGFLLLLAGGSAVICWRLFCRLGEAQHVMARLALPPLLLFCLIVYPAHSFAQREHLLLILTLPYVLLGALRLSRLPVAPGEAAAIAALAMLGIMLKPHFALVGVAVEGLLLVGLGPMRWLRSPVPGLMLVIGVAYVLAVLIWLPDYFGFVVPLVADHYHGFDPHAYLTLLYGEQVPVLVIGGVLLALAVGRMATPLTRLSLGYLAALTVAGLLQGKGWDYHFLAARAALLLAAGTALAALLARWRPAIQPWLGARLVAALLMMLFFLTGALSPPFHPQRAFADSVAGRLLPVVQAEAAHQPVLWLTSSIYPQFPVLNYTDSPLAMHFMSLWMLGSIYGEGPPHPAQQPYNAPEAMSMTENFVFRSVGADLARMKPALVVVADTRHEGGYNGRPFDYIDYFARDPRFAAEWRHYHPLTEIDGLRLFKREG